MRIVQLANFYGGRSGGLRTAVDRWGAGYVGAGHDVTALARTPEKAAEIAVAAHLQRPNAVPQLAVVGERAGVAALVAGATGVRRGTRRTLGRVLRRVRVGLRFR